MIWPEPRLLCLVWVMWVLDDGRGLERLVVRWRVVRGERDMVLGMEVFGRDLERERESKKLVDRGYNVAAASDSKGSILWLSVLRRVGRSSNDLPEDRSPLVSRLSRVRV